MVLGLLNKLQIFSQLYLIKLLGLSTGLGLLELWHLIYPELLTGLPHKLKSYGISGQIFGLVSSFLSNRWLHVVLYGKSSLEYPLNNGVPQGSILGRTLFLLHINDVICYFAIYADNTTLYSKCDQESGLWQHLELASELESDLQDSVDWGKKWLVDFSATKTHLVLFDRSNNNGSMDVKMDGFVLEEKSSFKILGLTFSSEVDWGSYIFSITKTASKKIGALICSMKFLSSTFLCISINLPYPHVWNADVTSGLVP